MSSNESDRKDIQTDTDAHYETIAMEEEIYLEETEEEERAILIFEEVKFES